MLPRFLDLTEGDALEECQSCRSRQGECPVGAVDVSGSLDERTTGDPFDLQSHKSGTGADDICDRVLGTHLMESYGLRRDAMDFPFGNSDPLEDREGSSFHLGIQGALFNEFPDLRMVTAMAVIGVISMPMGVVMPSMSVLVTVGMVMMLGRYPLAAVVTLDTESPA